MQTLTETLKKKAREAGLAKDEVFELVAATMCQLCCKRANGGNAK